MIRLLQDPARNGPTNMARDEALLVRVGASQSVPTLRLYQWDSPTISLGYFQRYADYDALEPPAGDLPVVRRLTGGGAILHDIELTYSLTLPVGHPLLLSGPNRLYEQAHDAVIASLRALDLQAERCGQTDDSGPTRGPFFCFARRHRFDVLSGMEKIAGSAQRRTREAVLQHGSIIVGRRFDQQPSGVLDADLPPTLDPLRSLFAQELTKATGESCEAGHWSQAETETAEELVPKYAGCPWTRRV